MGPRGAGHYVKMVHNGIEYGDMQLIAEAYDLLHRGAGVPIGELADIFTEWNAVTCDPTSSRSPRACSKPIRTPASRWST